MDISFLSSIVSSRLSWQRSNVLENACSEYFLLFIFIGVSLNKIYLQENYSQKCISLVLLFRIRNELMGHAGLLLQSFLHLSRLSLLYTIYTVYTIYMRILFSLG